ncbi:hypothetical protein BJV77DRAFT_1022435 [Russula vinacea]|nr:hypothetical protein BJV77DRAFT_1022435 [Russula vinacea]
MCVSARAVPHRGVKSIFYHVRRARNCLAKAGKWSPAEDEQLLRAVRTHGNDWSAVADLVQRSNADCSDRYHQELQYKDTKRRGAWSSEEEGRLLLVIDELARDGKTDVSARGFWVSVSKALGGTRTPKQCRNKWSDSLRGKIENEGKTRCWKEEDSYILVCKIASLDVDEETDIDWRSLRDPSWNMWSARFLRQKWRKLKASYTADEVICHRDVVHHAVTRTRPILRAGAVSSTPSST